MKVIFLDRDGVINSGGWVNTVDDFNFIDGSLEAIRLLTEAGYQLFIATNQGGIEAGYMTEAALAEIHAKMLEQIEGAGGEITKVYYCPHIRDCKHRKPNPGMILQAQQEFTLDLHNAFFIGDWITDFEAARAVPGVIPVHVQTGRGNTDECLKYVRNNKLFSFEDLYAFAQRLLKID